MAWSRTTKPQRGADVSETIQYVAMDVDHARSDGTIGMRAALEFVGGWSGRFWR
jgi:hypothetical protein